MRSRLRANRLPPEKPAFQFGCQICWQADYFGCIHAFNIAWPNPSGQPCADSSAELLCLVNGLRAVANSLRPDPPRHRGSPPLPFPTHRIGGMTWPKKQFGGTFSGLSFCLRGLRNFANCCPAIRDGDQAVGENPLANSGGVAQRRRIPLPVLNPGHKSRMDFELLTQFRPFAANDWRA